RSKRDWSSDVCSSDLHRRGELAGYAFDGCGGAGPCRRSGLGARGPRRGRAARCHRGSEGPRGDAMIDLVLCASGSDEVPLVRGHARPQDRPIRSGRPCADLTETLAVTAAGIGDVVLIDLAVRGVGRETLGTLMRDAAVVGLQAEDATERTRLGLRHVLPSSAPVEEVITVVTAVLDTDDAAPAEWVQDASSCAGSSTGRM